MYNYLLKKFPILLLSLVLVVTLTFTLSRLLPGDPFTQEEALDSSTLQTMRKEHQLDLSLLTQYFRYWNRLLQGDLGSSIQYPGQTAHQIIREGLPISLMLGFEALVICIPLGLALGMMASFKENKVATLLIALGLSLPSFILASVLQSVLSGVFGWFPVGRWGSFAHTVLPAFALSIMPTAMIAKLMRSSMTDVLQAPYILAARAKGLSSFQVMRRHVIPNALLPLLSYFGPLIVHITTGSFVVEKIFAIPGLGQWFAWSISNRDYPIILALTLFYTTFLMISVLATDLLRLYLNPLCDNRLHKK